MPASSQHNEQAATVPNLNETESERLGENPGRFLVEDLRADAGDGTTGELMLARIRGIVSTELIDYWLGVERWLAMHEDREPRDQVIDALEERKAKLQEQGDGLAQTGMSRDERREAAAEYDSESAAVLVDEDGEEISWSRQRGATVEASR